MAPGPRSYRSSLLQCKLHGALEHHEALPTAHGEPFCHDLGRMNHQGPFLRAGHHGAWLCAFQAFFALTWPAWGLALALARRSNQDKEALHDPGPGPKVLSSAEGGTEKAGGQAPWCSAEGKEVLHEQRKACLQTQAFFPLFKIQLWRQPSSSPNLVETPLQQMVAVGSPAPLTITTTSLLCSLCRTCPRPAPLYRK